MQGFNKYYPPDYDPSHGSLNAYRGKHALGDRARKLDQGILITRFELPFNIWCGTCNNHIGMGVRYNAEKKKVGNYHSTPIWSFRCKCHLCDGWFEIQTDPKNTRYVVVSGARQKDEEWNPEEHGGFAIHDTDKATAEVDPLAALEKTTDALNNIEKVQKPRIDSLQELSEQYNSDPYALSTKVRKRFREEKKIHNEKRKADDELKNRYGLPETLGLAEDDEASRKMAKEEWEKGKLELEQRRQQLQKRRKLEIEETRLSLAMQRNSKSATAGRTSAMAKQNAVVSALRARVLDNTARRSFAAINASQTRNGGSRSLDPR